jgi:hypothetical protein
MQAVCLSPFRAHVKKSGRPIHACAPSPLGENIQARQRSGRSISREPNAPRLDDNEAFGELVPVLGHEVRHDRREIGARVRRKAQHITPCARLAAA